MRGYSDKAFAHEAFKSLKAKNKENTFTVNFPY